MMIRPSLVEMEAYRKDESLRLLPVMKEIFSDFITPITALSILKNISQNVFLLESMEDREKWGRYTFLGYDPKQSISCKNGIVESSGLKLPTKDPKTLIRQILQEHKAPKVPGAPSFTGGLVGYFAYDFIQYEENSLHFSGKDEEDFQDLDLMLFDKVICFDHFLQKIFLIVNMSLSEGEAGYKRAVLELENMHRLLKSGEQKKEEPGRCLSDFRLLHSKEEYMQMVKKAKRHLKDGDIFQIVLSNRLEADYEGSLLESYRHLRCLNPSPYLFYFSSKDLELAGASPETLVKLEDGVLQTFPLAGTRKRGATEEEDKRIAMELLQDEKEVSEHDMLVDLGRNDIGKIAKVGTVKVEKYHEIQRYSHVMHIGSTVMGELKEGYDALDCVSAVLPAGTLSGAPKIRAMELIDDIEQNRRGIYGGGIGYIDFNGNLDLCIAIRFAYKKNGKVAIRSGAGIVVDSSEEKEFEECQNKARAMVEAIRRGEEEE